MDDARHREYTGVSNAGILENLTALGRESCPLWIRLPVVPGFNDGEEDIDALGRFLASLGHVQQVNLLPYHETGAHKARRLGRPDETGRAAAPSLEHLTKIAGRLQGYGLPVRMGG